MPQVFKSRRNILRAANKSKREHFTQTEYPDLHALYDEEVDGINADTFTFKRDSSNELDQETLEKLDGK